MKDLLRNIYSENYFDVVRKYEMIFIENFAKMRNFELTFIKFYLNLGTGIINKKSSIIC